MPRTDSPSVIIVGAGLAGLVAARDLQQRGLHIRIVDARDRVGGRVHTIRAPFEEDQYGEAGGELIEGEHQALCDLARSLGLRLIRVLRRGFGSYLIDGDGKPRRHASQSANWKQLAAASREALATYERAEHSWDSPVGRVFAQRSLAAHLDDGGGSGGRLRAIADSLRGFYLADPDDLSTLVLLDQLRSGGDPSQREMFRIEGGNDRLATTMADALGSAIALGVEVTAIAQTTGGARVAVRDRQGRLNELTTDYVIVTAPAPAVRRIRFEPTLPADQQQALATLAYGCATKTLLQSARPFWRGARRPWAYGTNFEVGALWDGSEHQGGRAAILVSLAGGSASAAARDLLRREGAEGFVRRLRWMRAPSGGRRIGTRRAATAGHSRRAAASSDEVLAHVSTTWEDDPWAGGGYAYFGTRFDPSLKRWLSAPAGRVLFAGEHTSGEWQGYMNGAVTSGQRAAVELLALAGRLS